MDCISAERFLIQDDKVKNILLDWWQAKCYDLLHDIKEKTTVIYQGENDEKHYIGQISYEPEEYSSLDRFIPLLTETQLRKFIQDNGYKYIGINNFLELDNVEVWNIKVFKNMNQFEPNFEIIHNCPLECYWYVVLRIIEEMEVK
jgi:hypothetical protein